MRGGAPRQHRVALLLLTLPGYLMVMTSRTVTLPNLPGGSGSIWGTWRPSLPFFLQQHEINKKHFSCFKTAQKTWLPVSPGVTDMTGGAAKLTVSHPPSCREQGEVRRPDESPSIHLPQLPPWSPSTSPLSGKRRGRATHEGRRSQLKLIGNKRAAGVRQDWSFCDNQLELDVCLLLTFCLRATILRFRIKNTPLISIQTPFLSLLA